MPYGLNAGINVFLNTPHCYKMKFIMCFVFVHSFICCCEDLKVNACTEFINFIKYGTNLLAYLLKWTNIVTDVAIGKIVTEIDINHI